jgi:hypothetical protein
MGECEVKGNDKPRIRFDSRVSMSAVWFVGTPPQIISWERWSSQNLQREAGQQDSSPHIATLIYCPSFFFLPLHSRSNQIRRIPKVLQAHKILLDTPRTNEPIKNTNAPRLIVRPACSRATKRLLPNYSARALLVVVHVASGVPEDVGCLQKGTAVGREDGPC